MPVLRPDKPVAWNFRKVVAPVVRAYFRRGDRLVRPATPTKRLHRFRIRTKRVRYVLELYQEPFPGAVGRALKQLRKLQQALGGLQDQAVVERRFHELASRARRPAARAELLAVAEHAARRQRELRGEFFRHWKRLRAAGFEERLLARIARC